MNSARSLWASVQGNPRFLQGVHGWCTIIFIFMLVVSEITGLVDSVHYVSKLSEIALVLGSWSAWQAARVEVRQEKLEQRASESDNP